MTLWTTPGQTDPLSDKPALLKKAADSLSKKDRKQADFYIARYLGLCAKDPAGCEDDALKPLLEKRRLSPKAFLPGEWDPGFIDWFERSVRPRWAAEPSRVREKARSFEIARSTWQNRYFATLVAYPELEQWHVMRDGLVSQPILLAMGAFRDPPTFYFGKILGNNTLPFRTMYLDTQKRTLHYIWKPDFYDLDGDGVPEVWLRYNLGWGNSFAQVLEVYRIREDRELVQLHRFQGSPEGVARRLENGDVEVGGSLFKQQEKVHRIETWRFEDKEFKKSGHKDGPFILKGSKWSEFYSD